MRSEEYQDLVIDWMWRNKKIRELRWSWVLVWVTRVVSISMLWMIAERRHLIWMDGLRVRIWKLFSLEVFKLLFPNEMWSPNMWKCIQVKLIWLEQGQRCVVDGTHVLLADPLVLLLFSEAPHWISGSDEYSQKPLK